MQSVLRQTAVGCAPARCSHKPSGRSCNTHSLGKASNLSIAGRIAQRRSPIVHGLVEKVTAEQLEVILQDRDRPLVIDFFATWCGPCILLATELEKVAQELGSAVRIVKVDVDEERDLSSSLQIEGLPTVIYVSTDPKKPALRGEGLMPAEQIKEIILTELK